MAEIVFAAGVSHAPGLTGWFDKAPVDDQRVVERAYDTLHEALVTSRVEVLLVVANDHIANARVGDYPDFTVGLADRHIGPDPWFRPWLRVPEYALRGDPEIATAVAGVLEGCGLDVRRHSQNLRFDDNLSVPATLARLATLDVRVVPVLQNCTVPVVPDERVCYAAGEALGAAIREELADGLRVGLLGSGGLSHEPGGPRYLEIDEKFDRWFLDLVVDGDHDRMLREATLDRMEQAGAGGTAELLSWQLVMGAIGPRPGTALGYVAVPEWRCGVGAVHWDMPTTGSAP